MALSTGVTKGLNNRISALTKETEKFRRLTDADAPHAAALADAAIVAAQDALAERITTAQARDVLATYTDHLAARARRGLI